MTATISSHAGGDIRVCERYGTGDALLIATEPQLAHFRRGDRIATPRVAWLDDRVRDPVAQKLKCSVLESGDRCYTIRDSPTPRRASVCSSGPRPPKATSIPRGFERKSTVVYDAFLDPGNRWSAIAS